MQGKLFLKNGHGQNNLSDIVICLERYLIGDKYENFFMKCITVEELQKMSKEQKNELSKNLGIVK